MTRRSESAWLAAAGLFIISHAAFAAQPQSATVTPKRELGKPPATVKFGLSESTAVRPGRLQPQVRPDSVSETATRGGPDYRLELHWSSAPNVFGASTFAFNGMTACTAGNWVDNAEHGSRNSISPCGATVRKYEDVTDTTQDVRRASVTCFNSWDGSTTHALAPGQFGERMHCVYRFYDANGGDVRLEYLKNIEIDYVYDGVTYFTFTVLGDGADFSPATVFNGSSRTGFDALNNRITSGNPPVKEIVGSFGLAFVPDCCNSCAGQEQSSLDDLIDDLGANLGLFRARMSVDDGSNPVEDFSATVYFQSQLSLEIAPGCQADGVGPESNLVTLELWMRHLPSSVTGFQAFVDFDDAVFNYRGDLSSYSNAPFPLHVQSIGSAQTGVGRLNLDGSDSFGGGGTSADSLLATLVFEVESGADCETTLLELVSDGPFDSEVSFQGMALPTALQNSPSFFLDNTPPALTCPPDLTVECDESTDPDAASTAPPGWELLYNARIASSGKSWNPYTLELRSVGADPAPNYSAAEWTPGGAMTFADLTELSADYRADLGCFGGGAPRFSVLLDSDNDDEADGSVFVYWGSPPGFTDCPALGVWQSTGNLMASPDARFDSTQFGGPFYGTHATTSALVGTYEVVGIVVAVDASWLNDQIYQVDGININGTVHEFGGPSATDNCDAAPGVSYSDVNTPGGCPNEFTISRTWTAVDECGNETSCVQTIEVVDTTPPEMTCLTDVTVECDQSTDPLAASMMPEGWELFFNAAVVASGKATNPSALELRSVSTDTVPQVSAAVWTPSSAMTFADLTELGTEYKALQGCFGGGSPRFTIRLDNNDDGIPDGGVHLYWGTVPNYTDCPPIGVWTSTGNLLASSDARFDLTGFGGGFYSTYAQALALVGTYDVTWITTAVDAYWVNDQQYLVDSFRINGAVHQFGAPSATDNCDAAPDITYSDVNSDGACPQSHTISRTWTATDDCGNETSCVQTIEVVDTTAPTIDCPVDATVECDESTDPSNTGEATAMDNCDGNPTVAHSDVTTNGVCAAEYVITRTWTATDACGNESSCIQTINVEDTTAPAFTSCPSDITTNADSGGCDAVVTWDAPVATDNCGTPVVVCSPPSGSTFPTGTTPVECTATDECGNVSACGFDVTVNGVNEVNVEVELAGVNLPVSRCIHFVVDDCGTVADETLSFTDHDGDDANENGVIDATEGDTNMPSTPVRASAQIEIGCGAWTSLCAKDEQHTLYDSTTLTDSGTEFSADTLLSLRGGDTDNDSDVDIHDVTYFLFTFGFPENVGGCPWNGMRGADFSNNGNTGAEDYTFLTSNWLAFTACGCAARQGGDDAAWSAVSVRVTDLAPEVAARADLNGDGVVDYRDVAEFEARHGLPQTLSTRIRMSAAQAE